VRPRKVEGGRDLRIQKKNEGNVANDLIIITSCIYIMAKEAT
jgi:hypothetical protein